MRHLYTLLTISAIVLGASSCSSTRNAQNTDDIYYSDGSRKAVAAADGEYYPAAPSDNYIRMKATDPERWSYFDDYNAYDAYYAPGYAYGMYPSYGMSYGLGFGYGMGLGYGLGFYDPFMAWNSYYMWNCWYNPYFYNPYYGGAVFVVGKTVASGPAYANLRPFSGTAYRPGVHSRVYGTSSGRFYRTGMSGTSAYNNQLNRTSTRPVNTYRPFNNNTYRNNTYRPANNFNNGGYRPATNFGGSGRSFSPSVGGGGGGMRAGGFGGRH